MANKMFRFLDKLIGTYRVKAYYDLETNDFPRDDHGNIDEDFDDEYIPCKRGVIKHTYRQDRGKYILAWYSESSIVGKNVLKQIKHDYPDMWIEVDECDSFDFYIYFEYNDIDKIASIVVPTKNGAKIRPYSVKNLPKVPYEIPEADNKKLEELIEDLDKTDKMLFVKRACKEFSGRAEKLKKKNFDYNAELKKSKLRPKQFIHSIGLWNEYIAFVKELRQKEKG